MHLKLIFTRGFSGYSTKHISIQLNLCKTIHFQSFIFYQFVQFCVRIDKINKTTPDILNNLEYRELLMIVFLKSNF